MLINCWIRRFYYDGNFSTHNEEREYQFAIINLADFVTMSEIDFVHLHCAQCFHGVG